jgi:hypothetical protein
MVIKTFKYPCQLLNQVVFMIAVSFYTKGVLSHCKYRLFNWPHNILKACHTFALCCNQFDQLEIMRDVFFRVLRDDITQPEDAPYRLTYFSALAFFICGALILHKFCYSFYGRLHVFLKII